MPSESLRLLLQLALFNAAAWVFVLSATRHSRGDALRFLVALGLGAAFAHWLWCLQHPAQLSLGRWLDPSAGVTVLGLPVGVALAAPWRQGRRAVLDYLDACARALPPALALAKLGCFAAGCCAGVAPGAANPWLGTSITAHPVQLYEAATWLAVWSLVHRAPGRFAPTVFLVGFGAARLLLEPLRTQHAMEATRVFPPEALAGVWLLVGLVMYAAAGQHGRRLLPGAIALGLGIAPTLPASGVEPTPAATPPESALIATLPFEFVPGGQIVVDLAPEGSSPFELMLDTGASGSVMTVREAKARGVNIRRTKSTPYRRATTLGRDVHFYVDTRRSDTGTSSPIEYALLGSDFLSHYVVEIDYSGQRVRFYDPNRFQVPEVSAEPDARVVPMQIPGTRPFIEVSVEGEPLQALVDTGAYASLVVSGSTACRLGIAIESLHSLGRIGSVFGLLPARFYETRRFELAGWSLGPTPVVVPPRGFFNVAGTDATILGADLLRQFTLRIDYSRRRLWMRRDRTPSLFGGQDYAAQRSFGALLSPTSEGLRVAVAFPETAAANVGLQAGDEITTKLFDGDLTAKRVTRRITLGGPLHVSRVAEDGRRHVVTLRAEAPATD